MCQLPGKVNDEMIDDLDNHCIESGCHHESA